ncbi:MAG: nucleotide exchange factor GrpE [bacterium]
MIDENENNKEDIALESNSDLIPDLKGENQKNEDQENQEQIGAPDNSAKKKKLFSRKCKFCEREKEKCKEYKSGWQRALADYKNLQNEIESNRQNWIKMSEAGILEDFLPVYDNFKTAFATDVGLEEINANESKWKNWKQGIEYIKKQFLDILNSYGIEELKTLGEKFDPKFHEVMAEEEAKGSESGIIIKEISGGYKIKDKVLKASKVIITK